MSCIKPWRSKRKYIIRKKVKYIYVHFIYVSRVCGLELYLRAWRIRGRQTRDPIYEIGHSTTNTLTPKYRGVFKHTSHICHLTLSMGLIIWIQCYNFDSIKSLSLSSIYQKKKSLRSSGSSTKDTARFFTIVASRGEDISLGIICYSSFQRKYSKRAF